MSWTDELDHPFAGIAKKLERADENIVNLHNEIISFFESSKYPIIPNPDTPGWQEAVNYHRDLPVPIRFRVLCGEIVHHLRSSLDHIVWNFSSAGYRLDDPNAIEFPVLRTPPTTKGELRRYERKIKGIASAEVRRLIAELQPYHLGNDAVNHPLCIVHDMDRYDKHRELTIVSGCANVVFPSGITSAGNLALQRHKHGEVLSGAEIDVLHEALTKDAKVTPQVAFAQFGNMRGEFVVPALKRLKSVVADAVGRFANEA